MLGNTGGRPRARPVHRRPALPGLRVARPCPGVLRIAYPQFIHYEFYVPIEAEPHEVRRRHGAVQDGLAEARVLRQVPRWHPLAVPRQLLRPGPLDGVDRPTPRRSACTGPTSRCSSGAASSRRATRSHAAAEHPSRRRGRAVSLAAPPRPTVAWSPPGARVPRDRRSATGRPTVFLHGGGPGCTAWTDFGPVAPLFAADRRCDLVDLLQYGKSDKPIDHRSDVGLPRRLDRRAARRARHRARRPRVQLVGRHDRPRPGRRATPSAPARLVVTGSMPVFYGPLGAAARGRAPRPQRPRRATTAATVRRWEKMRQLMARLEWFDARPHPRRDRDDALRAEPRSRRDGARRRAPTSRAASGRTSAPARARSAARCCSAGACTTASSRPTTR